MTRFEREIREQPECLARLLDKGREGVAELAVAIREFGPAFIVTAARGSSDNAARYAKYLFGAHNRLVVSLGAPSLITLYGSAPSFRRALVIGISQSGESPDIVALLAEARRQGAFTLAMTNQPRSPLGDAAEHAFDLRAGAEHAVVATKSYTCQLLALAMLSAAMEETDPDRSGGRGNGGAAYDANERWRALGALPAAVEETLALNPAEELAAGITPLAATERMLVIGRGFNFATAFEVALKIKETAYVMAEPYAAPDLFHGPLAMVEPGFPALVIAPMGATSASMIAAFDALESRGARLLTISNSAAVLDRPGTQVRLPFAAGVPEWLTPIVAAIPGQLCALHLARARKLNPDHPRGLTKITRTR